VEGIISDCIVGMQMWGWERMGMGNNGERMGKPANIGQQSAQQQTSQEV